MENVKNDVDIAEAVVRFRARHNLSMKQFADKIGVTWQTVWNIENRKYTPQRTTAAKIRMILESEKVV